ncbi:MAG: OmpA family protein [Acidobacteriota bacterium]|nr:OmpA family protein [Blastocatellia bacterium]MDW8411378.1 OmpA family protein [Acidobacteriota bacterium]
MDDASSKEALQALRLLLLTVESTSAESEQLRELLLGQYELDELSALRKLLFGEQLRQIAELQRRLDDAKIRSREVSRILPEAIILRAARDKHLVKALSPVFEEAFLSLLRREPRKFAESIAPVIGPAVRRSIQLALAQLLQSLNQTLDYALSIKGWSWRWEAFRTGKPFAEVVISHTLLYRVEQVFLIHRKTGLLLQHVVAGSIQFQDPDLVSGMLTAIKDFVQDSFGETERGLETLQLGDLAVWIEQGPHAILAVVIRGIAPQSYRAVLQDSLEGIHVEYGYLLDEFDGDAAAFESCRPQLERCLQMQLKTSPASTNKAVPALLAVLGFILVSIVVFVVWSIYGRYRFEDLVRRVDAVPGIVVLSAERREGKYFISGLRDRLADEPQVADASVVVSWEAFQSYEPEIVRRRLLSMLQLPRTVIMEFRDGMPRFTGWARRQWLVRAQEVVTAIGVDKADFSGVVDLDSVRERLEARELYFSSGTQLVDGQRIDAIVSDLKLLDEAKKAFGIRVEILGYADRRTGTKRVNLWLSTARAQRIRDMLVAEGIDPALLEARADKDFLEQRKVKLRVFLLQE